MSYIIRDCVQGSDEWKHYRLGKFTASTFSDLFMGKTTKGYQGLINAVVFERLTGESPESFSNEWMKRGNELEGEALEAYESMTFNKVERVGFIELTEWIGASPDGLVGADGMVQVKCPKASTLIDYHLSGSVPSDYMYQMQGELMVSGRKWNDFFVYHPKLKPLLRRIIRDEKMIAEITAQLQVAITTAGERIRKIGGAS